jgi:hypothetical protein
MQSMMHVHISARLHLIRKTSLITEQNQVSNHLLVGGYVVNHPFTVAKALSFTTHLLEKQLRIGLQIAKT